MKNNKLKEFRQNQAKQKVVTVLEIKEIDPLIEVYQLSPHYSYIITIEKSNLVGGAERATQKAQSVLKMCNAAGIPAFVMVADKDIKFYGFESKSVKASDFMPPEIPKQINNSPNELEDAPND